jgi:hypothetical protein
MAFDDDVTKDGRGRALRLDVSLDNWATVAYRYGSVAGQLDGTNWYDARILNEPSVRRALGNNRIATSGGCEVVLANPDGAIDWLCGRESISTASKARFKLYVVLFDPANVVPANFTAKLLGDFFLGEWPRQTSSEVRLSLADAMMAPLARGAQLPTIADWAAVGDPTNNPLRAGAGSGLPSYGLPDTLTPETPIQLAFGDDFLEAMPHILPWENTATAYFGKIIVPICCTTEADAVNVNTVGRIRVAGMNGADAEVLVELRPTFGRFESTAQAWNPNSEAWRAEKSPAITKDGRTFYVVYAVVDASLGEPEALRDERMSADGLATQGTYALMVRYEFAGGYPSGAVRGLRLPLGNELRDGYALFGSRVVRWYVKGSPLSAITNKTFGYGQNAVDVIADLVQSYSPGSLAVDSASRNRVSFATRHIRIAGVVQPWRSYDPNRLPASMRQVITAIAQSGDIDVFVTWSGTIAFASDIWDGLQATDLITIAESRQGTIERWVAGEGERGAPFNRVVLEGGRDNPAEAMEAPIVGPFDLPTEVTSSSVGGAVYVAATDRILELVLQQGWTSWMQQSLNPLNLRMIDASARDRIRFTTSLDGLRLDLGSYFKLEWTDNRGAPYASPPVCQCEAITYLAQSDEVEVEAVWRDETTDARNGYLMDDETLLVRVKTDVSTIDLDLDSGTVTMNSIGIAWGDPGFEVVPGDILVVRDSTEAATAFVRHASWRIESLDTDQVATITPVSSGVFAGILNADWYIVAGATSYEAAAAAVAPASYTAGADIYGKVTDAAGEFSDTTTGNRLLDG